MDRGTFLKSSGMAGLGLLALPTLSDRSETSGPSVDRPNVLLILVDDMRADQMQTGLPNAAAALSAGGVSFGNAHVGTPQCSPSRCSLLTGKYAHRTGQWHNKWSANRFKKHDLAFQSLPYLMQRFGGYKTSHVGKWLNYKDHIASWVPPGYDHFVSPLLDRAPVTVCMNGKMKTARWWAADDRPAGDPVWRSRETEWLTNRCLQWIEEQDGPWFATLSLSSPHDPYTPAPEHAGSYSGVPMPKSAAYDAPPDGKPAYMQRGPLTNAEKSEIEAAWRGQMEELRSVDEQVTRAAEAVGDDAYVVFLSDNGYMLGNFRRYRKQVPYAECTRTPLHVRGPGVTGGASNALVSSLDVPATVAELAGIGEEMAGSGLDIDGRGLSPILFAPPATQDPGDPDPAAVPPAPESGPDTEEAGAEPWRSRLLIEQAQEYGPIYGGWQAVRTQDGALYVEHSTGEHEYYPASDPLQMTNVADEHGEEVARLSSSLRTLSAASGDALRAAETAT